MGFMGKRSWWISQRILTDFFSHLFSYCKRNASSKLASTCESVWPGLYARQFFVQLVSQRLKASHFSCTNRGVTLCNGQQLAKLRPRRTDERIMILIGWLSKALWGKLLEGCYTVQRRLKVAAIVAKSRTEFYFVQCCGTSYRGNMLRRAILQQLVGRNDVARQVAEKIAQCNTAFNLMWNPCPRQLTFVLPCPSSPRRPLVWLYSASSLAWPINAPVRQSRFAMGWSETRVGWILWRDSCSATSFDSGDGDASITRPWKPRVLLHATSLAQSFRWRPLQRVMANRIDEDPAKWLRSPEFSSNLLNYGKLDTECVAFPIDWRIPRRLPPT